MGAAAVDGGGGRGRQGYLKIASEVTVKSRDIYKQEIEAFPLRVTESGREEGGLIFDYL
jgi:hypothetical protein